MGATISYLIWGTPEKAEEKIEEPESEDEETSELVGNVIEYCKPLLSVRFFGQTNQEHGEHTDVSTTKNIFNLGLYLSLLDKFLRGFKSTDEFTGEEEEYLQLLKFIAMKRKREGETSEKCHKRLLRHSKRFIQIYHKRGVLSEPLETEEFWGTRQQMLAAKVICDWIEKEIGPLDPIFGVLLNPTAGRVGPGDTGWFHNVLFDETGYMAYHSAVHDGFGYLGTNHQCGPGYDYLGDSFFSKNNSLAGQTSGIAFWKEVIDEVKMKAEVIKKIKM